MRLFLTSSISSVTTKLINKLKINPNTPLLYVDTPAETENGDLSWLKEDELALNNIGFDVERYSITNKSKSIIQKKINNFEYIYISGGNTFYMLKMSQTTGFIDIIKDSIINKHKTYIGTSSGSMITSPDCKYYKFLENDIEGVTDYTGFNFVNFLIFPHWGSQYFKKDYIKFIENTYYSTIPPVILLTDNQYIYVNGSEISIN